MPHGMGAPGAGALCTAETLAPATPHHPITPPRHTAHHLRMPMCGNAQFPKGGGGISGGAFLQPHIPVFCVQLWEPQSLGYTADAQKNLLGYTLGTEKLFWYTQDTQAILLPLARHLEERLTVSQSVSQSGKQSGRQSVGNQAGRQAGRNTQFGFFSVADYIYKQWGTLLLLSNRRSSGRTLTCSLKCGRFESRPAMTSKDPPTHCSVSPWFKSS